MANIIYTNLFEGIEQFKKLQVEGRIVQTSYLDKSSENSYCFKVGNYIHPSKTKDYCNELLKTTKKNFNINNSSFDEKFCKVIKGAGQEWRTINVFHSSSLLCLLCFYNVSEQNPLDITIDGKVCRFTASEFEVQNKIGKNGQGKPYYSHIDVKLSGVCEGKSVALYLESKFSEYVNQRGKQKFTFTKEYDSIYSKLSGKIDDLKIDINKNETISLSPADKNRPAQYWQGIKQMVSHYLGMKNCTDTSDIIYLGEILYDFSPYIYMPLDYLSDYKKMHKQLVTALEEIETEPQRFTIIKNILTYQDVFQNYELDKQVRELYKL